MRWATIDMTEKSGAACSAPFAGGQLSPRLTQGGLGRGLLPYQMASSSIRLATIDIGRKLGAMPRFRGRTGSPSNTTSPGPRPTSVPSGILIHPAVWPQRTRAEKWGLCRFRGEGAGSPSNITLPRLRPTSVPSGILMHPAVWPQ